MNKESISSLSGDKLFDTLKSSKDGLTKHEVNEKLQQYGLNVFQHKGHLSALSIFLKQFRSSLIYLLFVACILSFILGDVSDGVVIAVILIINTLLGFYQEYKSEKAVDKLQKLVNKEILVIRDGQQTLVPETHLVIGDIVILKEGDVVPADIKLIEANDLSANESQLTGESLPVHKTSHGVSSLVFSGSVIEEGEAKGLVYATAAQTELGKIANLSTETKRVTQFERSLNSFSGFLVKVTFFTLAAIFIVKLILIHDTSQIGTLALFIIALSIAVVPEAMPVIVTVTLAKGALNLAKRHVIAKTLTAVEDFGNINVLCSDKTGTLTENKQTVKKLIAKDENLFQRLAIVSLESSDEKRAKHQSSFDQALINFIPHEVQQQMHNAKRLIELPFDPIARRRRVLFENDDKTFLVEVGSVETLLELTHDHHTKEYLNIIKEDGLDGLRHLGIAYKEVEMPKNGKYDILKDEDDLKFVGFVSLEDPLRPTAKKTIRLAEDLGVKIIILSGDSLEVTRYVAIEVGLIKNDEKVYTGEEIDHLNDTELSDVVNRSSAFARLNPEQKYRIINVLKHGGLVVGYQGDGINDAPSLKLADVAIAVNGAADVAKDSADILLLHNDLEVIVNGIKYGRTIFSNINKYIRYTFVGNFGNFFALSALYLISGTALPILPVQVLLSNLLTDVPLITIATDNVETEDLLRPSKFNIHSLMFISMFLGTVTAMFEIMFYAIIKNHSVGIIQTGLFIFLTPTQLMIILAIRNKDHFWNAPKMTTAMKNVFGITALISVLVTYIGATQKLFGFMTLPISIAFATVALSTIYVFTLDIIKVWFYKTHNLDQYRP